MDARSTPIKVPHTYSYEYQCLLGFHRLCHYDLADCIRLCCLSCQVFEAALEDLGHEVERLQFKFEVYIHRINLVQRPFE
jgi:hypothetical protein